MSKVAGFFVGLLPLGVDEIPRKMAGCPMVGLNFNEFRLGLDADIFDKRTAGIEITAWRRVGWAGNIPLQDDPAPAFR